MVPEMSSPELPVKKLYVGLPVETWMRDAWQVSRSVPVGLSMVSRCLSYFATIPHVQFPDNDGHLLFYKSKRMKTGNKTGNQRPPTSANFLGISSLWQEQDS